MRKPYRNIGEVLRSPWAKAKPVEKPAAQTDRVLRSTKLEDSIYADLRRGDAAMDAIEQAASEKLDSFPALSRDVFQSFYSLMPRQNDTETLSAAAQKFNAQILGRITQSDDYATLKSICEGRELPAYEAASEFIARTAEHLDELLEDIGGNPKALDTLEKLRSAEEKAKNDLTALLERLWKSKEKNATLEEAVLAAANTAESKRRQTEAVGRLIDTNTAQHKEEISAQIVQSLHAAANRAEEVQNILGAWSNEPGNMQKSEVNTELLELVRQSSTLMDISRYLGRFRELFEKGKRNSYAYGRGEKYSLELGNDLSRVLSSELAMLAMPETLPLFLRKYQRRQLKQYQRRMPIYKGMGDVICCLDESSSTEGDPAAWGKAVALTLLEIAASNGRSFALVHFASRSSLQTDLFRPGGYTAQDKLRAAETFLSGGTNFEAPLRESLRLMEEEGFENADVVFITDGECTLPEAFQAQLTEEQMKRRFTVTGILLDKDSPGSDFSLQPFCQNVYRTSELLEDQIVEAVIGGRI